MIKKFFASVKSAALKILDLDDTEFPRDQFEFIYDTSRKRIDWTRIQSEDIKKFLYHLQEMHMVDSITVSTKAGTLIGSSNGVGNKEALDKTALFNYIDSEIPSSEVVLIKSNDWHILVPFKENVYIIKAKSDLTKAELNAIIEEAEKFIKFHPSQEKSLLST